jgi:NitT/TauT family transport system permease protein
MISPAEGWALVPDRDVSARESRAGVLDTPQARAAMTAATVRGPAGPDPSVGTRRPPLTPDGRGRPAAPAAGLRRWSPSGLTSVLSVVGGLAIWELVGVLGLVDPLFLPRLSQTLGRLGTDFADARLLADIGASALPFALGVGLAIVLGCLLGVLMGLTSFLDRVLTPWVLGFNAIPRIAFVPIFIVVFGLGMEGKSAVVVATALFPMVLNMRSGVKSVDAELLEMGTAFRASRMLVLRRIVLPSTLPFFISGFRITIALGLIGEVVAEFFSSNAGVGYRLNIASQTYDITEVYAMIILLAAVGIALSQIVSLLERRIERWQGGRTAP